MMPVRDFQSVQGPTDPMLNRSEIEGYQPVSRIGEIVINSFGKCLTCKLLSDITCLTVCHLSLQYSCPLS